MPHIDLRRKLPRGLLHVARELEKAGFPTYVVGGAVRDLLRGAAPGDIDLASAARPSEVERIFGRTFNKGAMREHGTVGVIGPHGDEFEVTTFRTDLKTDGRHATIGFADSIEEDLVRRDFTMNALAWSPATGALVDPHGGRQDLKKGLLRAVGDPASRFREDYLRILRGFRFAGTMNLKIEEATLAAMAAEVDGLRGVSSERVREELLKLLAKAPAGNGGLITAFRMMEDTGALEILLPEIARLRGVSQPPEHHAYDVLDHTLAAADQATPAKPLLRLGMLFHDVGKPDTRVSEGGRISFHGHDEVGAEIAAEALRRLRFTREEVETVREVVVYHMRFHQFSSTGDGALRRLARNLEYLELSDLVDIRYWDKLGSGVGRSEVSAGRREEMHDRVREVMAAVTAPAAGRSLAVGGRDLMAELDLPEGALIGQLLRTLQEAVDEDPALNQKEALLAEAKRALPTLL